MYVVSSVDTCCDSSSTVCSKQYDRYEHL